MALLYSSVVRITCAFHRSYTHIHRHSSITCSKPTVLLRSEFRPLATCRVDSGNPPKPGTELLSVIQRVRIWLLVENHVDNLGRYSGLPS